MEMLLASVLALVAGPLIVRPSWSPRVVVDVLDGFVLAGVGGLALVYLLPAGIAHGGVWAAAAALAGLAAPRFIEERLESGHGAVLIVAVIGLALHGVVDGAALTASHGHHEHAEHLGLAVILHRLPVGLLLYWSGLRHGGMRWAVGLIGIVALATVGGYLAGEHALDALPAAGIAIFECFVVGSLLHVVMHAASVPSDAPAGQIVGQEHLEDAHDHEHDHCGGGHDDPCAAETEGNRWPAAIGALIAIGGFVAGGEGPHLPHTVEGAVGAGPTFWSLALVSAPALLAAYLGAGLLRVWMLPATVRWLGRGGAASQAFRGMAFGLPLPICSCGVLPVYQTLVERGAPGVAALAFLVATPELGLDAVLISIPLLGEELTIARVAAAVGVALLAGVLVGRGIAEREIVDENGNGEPRPPVLSRLFDGLRYGLGDLVDHTLPWVVVGLAIAAIFEPVLDPEWMSGWPAALQVPLFALVGIPMYVCASGATPLAAVLILKGVSPGAALAFLLTGPATNATTFGVLSNLHGRRLATIFGLTVGMAAISAGWAVDVAVGDVIGHIGEAAHGHEDAAPLQTISLVAIALLLILSMGRQGPRAMVRQVLSPHS